MNPVRILRASAATVVVALSLLVLRAAERPAIVGSWNCVSSAPDGYAQTWTLTVTKQDDGKLAARVGGGSLGDVAVTDFKAEADKVSFTAETGGNTYSVKLTVDGSKLEGTFEGEQASGKIKGTRKS